ncbi:MAG: hypothetical protein IT244_03105 [Bacteroidia bacterium]|nr:hypothetical protein [Bacteroidia bacterium]
MHPSSLPNKTHQNMNKKELWQKLFSYHFEQLVPTHLWDEIAAKFGGENPFTLAFADKLCRKYEWKKQFALKAIWEYKKFVFLGVISEFKVTPSSIIDQVWHEHLLFSVGYRKFCKDVIEHEFDHHPELTPSDTQTEAFQAQYYQTLVLYETEFGMQAPQDIWGNTKFKAPADTAAKKETYTSTSDVSSDSGTLVSMCNTQESIDLEFEGGGFDGGGAGGSWDAADTADGGDGGTSCSSGCGSCGGD